MIYKTTKTHTHTHAHAHTHAHSKPKAGNQQQPQPKPKPETIYKKPKTEARTWRTFIESNITETVETAIAQTPTANEQQVFTNVGELV